MYGMVVRRIIHSWVNTKPLREPPCDFSPFFHFHTPPLPLIDTHPCRALPRSPRTHTAASPSRSSNCPAVLRQKLLAKALGCQKFLARRCKRPPLSHTQQLTGGGQRDRIWGDALSEARVAKQRCLKHSSGNKVGTQATCSDLRHGSWSTYLRARGFHSDSRGFRASGVEFRVDR